MNDSSNQPSGPIEPLKKVVLSIAAGTTREHMDLTPQPFKFGFIHGIGTTGLSSFEQMLVNKGPGDEIEMRVPIESQKDYLGHLALPPILFPLDLKVFYLQVLVEAVRAASNREVIQGLAGIAECGEGCWGHSQFD